MPVLLRKGQRVTLLTGTNRILIGLGWDPNRALSREDFDLDASAFILRENGKVASDEDFVFYNHPDWNDGTIYSTGDDRTGEFSDGGDDERLYINLSRIPTHVARIAITVTIHDAIRRRQNFGQIKNAFVRLASLNDEGREIETLFRYNLSCDYSAETALVVCELYRRAGQWKFNAVGSGFYGGLEALCRNYGVEVD